MKRGIEILLLLASCAAAQDGSIAGRVVDAVTGQPLHRVHVRLSAGGFSDSPPVLYGALNDSDGHFSISPIPPGTYRIEPELRGYFFMSKSPIVTIKPGERLEDFRIELTPRAILSGRVLDEHGEPVDFVGVSVRPASYKDVGVASALEMCCMQGVQVNEHGEFRIAVPPGKLRLEAPAAIGVEVRADGTLAPVFYSETYYPGTADPEAAAAVEARPGQETSGLEIHLVRKQARSIAGTVTGAPPDASVTVHVFRSYEEDGISMAAGKDGTFSASQLEPASYLVYAESGAGDSKLQSSRLAIELDSDMANVGLVLKPPANLTGVVTGAAHTTVRLVSPLRRFDNRPAHIAPVSDDGAFRFDRLPPDRYILTVKPLPEDGYIRSVELNGTKVAERLSDFNYTSDATAPRFQVPLDLTGIAGSSELKIVIGKGARMSGAVDGNSGRVTDGFGYVELIPEGSDNGILSVNVDSGGNYVLHGIPPGKYRAIATHALDWSADDDGATFKKLLGKADLAEFHEGERVTKDLTVAQVGDAKKNP